MYYIGVDLGTSALKLVMMKGNGELVKTVSKEYPLYFPRSGWSEQNPTDWFSAVKEGLKELAACTDEKIAGISFGGQMHGLVILDKDDNVLRPAILWNDGRSTEETDYLNNVIGKEKLSKLTANIAFAGFTAPKILWVKNNEPEIFAKISKIMLPKDYISYMSEDMLPKLYESYEVVGAIKPELAKELGLNEGIKIVAGAGDNAAAAIGTATVGEGACNISLGTSGTVFISSKNFGVDNFNALHSFAHADGNYHLMGCMLSAASCNKWWMEEILKTKDFAKEQSNIDNLGENNVFFLPYLMGERSPHNDPDAAGTFIGMRMDTKREDMTLAVFEGVTFALRDSLEVARSLGIKIEKTMICGGGAKSPLWKRLVANILNVEVDVPMSEEGPGFGAAILAAVGCGEYESVEKAAKSIIKIKEKIKPEANLVVKYEEKYQKFKRIYPALKDVFKEIR